MWENTRKDIKVVKPDCIIKVRLEYDETDTYTTQLLITA